MINSLLEMKTSSSNYRLLILLIWFLCYCSLCSSVRIIGDQRSRTSGDDVLQCNNTVQGRYLLSDSRGYVCNIMAVDPATACCPVGGEQYSCQGCNTLSQCCSSYEYCVSCCLNPMRTALEVALKTKLARQATAGMWTSLFDYCSGRCRHNSESVVHENAYVSGEHHCFSAKSIPPGEAVEASAEDELADVSVIVGGTVCYADKDCLASQLAVQRAFPVERTNLRLLTVVQSYSNTTNAKGCAYLALVQTNQQRLLVGHPSTCTQAHACSALKSVSYHVVAIILLRVDFVPVRDQRLQASCQLEFGPVTSFHNLPAHFYVNRGFVAIFGSEFWPLSCFVSAHCEGCTISCVSA